MRYDAINSSPGWSLKIAGNSNYSSEFKILPATNRAILPPKRDSRAANADDRRH